MVNGNNRHHHNSILNIHLAGALVGWQFIKKSTEKYGETSGANDDTYLVSGIFSLHIIGNT